jgi:predicted nucleotide-binding protein (sugar kinase/HSP70/actin superfamily)
MATGAKVILIAVSLIAIGTGPCRTTAYEPYCRDAGYGEMQKRFLEEMHEASIGRI